MEKNDQCSPGKKATVNCSVRKNECGLGEKREGKPEHGVSNVLFRAECITSLSSLDKCLAGYVDDDIGRRGVLYPWLKTEGKSQDRVRRMRYSTDRREKCDLADQAKRSNRKEKKQAIQQKRKEASDPIQKKRNHGMVVERNDVQDRKERYTQRRSKSDQVA